MNQVITKYRHDCSCCKYLGKFSENEWYYCTRRESLVSRYGNDTMACMSISLHTVEQLMSYERPLDTFEKTPLEALGAVYGCCENEWILEYFGPWFVFNEQEERLREYLAHPRSSTLLHSLRSLRNIAVNYRTKCKMFKDFAPLSFCWQMENGKLHGGLIYHGAHDHGGDGGAPTFSVNLSPTDGWSLHT